MRSISKSLYACALELNLKHSETISKHLGVIHEESGTCHRRPRHPALAPGGRLVERQPFRRACLLVARQLALPLERRVARRQSCFGVSSSFGGNSLPFDRPSARSSPHQAQLRCIRDGAAAFKRVAGEGSLDGCGPGGQTAHRQGVLQLPWKLGAFSYSNCQWQAAAGRNCPLRRRLIQLQPVAPRHLLPPRWSSRLVALN
jgi:hypothetical protein